MPTQNGSPIWISNLGVESVSKVGARVSISFEEIADVLELIAAWADRMEDPGAYVRSDDTTPE